jgi:hypothetical protein
MLGKNYKLKIESVKNMAVEQGINWMNNLDGMTDHRITKQIPQYRLSPIFELLCSWMEFVKRNIVTRIAISSRRNVIIGGYGPEWPENNRKKY